MNTSPHKEKKIKTKEKATVNLNIHDIKFGI